MQSSLSRIIAMATSPDIDLARARLLVACADQARKKSKSTHKGSKLTADKENEDLQVQEGTCTTKKSLRAVSVAYVALYAHQFQDM